MSNPESYLTIEKEVIAEFKDRGSRFIAYAFPVSTIDECKKKLKELKKEHHKAVHHCFAYRIGIEGEQYRANDDGEPSGTAGLPILGQIDSRQLCFVAVIVVRYFGGTLLGKPGLITAYKSAASMALQAAAIIKKAIQVSYELSFDYTRLDQVMQVLRQFSCNIIKREAELFCRMTIAVPVSKAADFEEGMSEIFNVEINKLI